ncbi:MAG: ABC transporter substrate-binding protein [Eubacterium sp.]|nr:ABC transporter substrate-binding protein [Eubacterium sp.]
MKTVIKKYLTKLALGTMLLSCAACTSGKTDTATTQTTEANDKLATAGDMAEVESVGYEGMEAVYPADIEDGTYDIDVDCSSSMFKIISCSLTVKDGAMTADLTMGGKGYLYIFMGTGEEALVAQESDYINYEEDSEGTHHFKLPVEALDKEIKCTAFSKKKEKWYDRALCFRADSLPDSAFKGGRNKGKPISETADGTYTIGVTLEGGSGKASVTSPAKIVIKDGKATATIEWSSSNYDYMIVGEEKYLPVNTDGNSVFEIPVAYFDAKIPVRADTTAMSKPHEIEYTLYFDLSTLIGGEAEANIKDWGEAVLLSGLDLSYAKNFSVDYYGSAGKDVADDADKKTDAESGGYALVTISTGEKFLVVPKGCSVPEKLDKDIAVINEGDSNIYAASSACYDIFRAAGSLGNISFTSTKADEWSIPEVKAAVQDGSIKYVGKYSSPDFETLVSGGVKLAIENTMIYHKPEIKEELEKLGIAVIVDQSSLEKDPLGRMEWIKLYGIITGHLKEAEEFFDREVARVDGIKEKAVEGKDSPTIAYFYISTKGYAVVRKTGDYIPKMIKMGGGKYVFDSIKGEDEDALSTTNMDLETFYATAKDADIIIYDTAIDSGIGTLDELITSHTILYDFKAVENRRVYLTGADLFQQTSAVADLIEDISTIVNEDENELHLLHPAE